MIYFVGWAAVYFSLAIQTITKYYGRFFLSCLLVFFAAVAFLRGSIGTDTANYEQMLSAFIDNYVWGGREPGFVVLGWLLAMLAPTVEIAVRAIALVFFALLALFVFRADRNERFLLLAYLLPAYVYHYSMNALRIGLASAVLLLAVQLFRKNGNMSAIRMGLAALLFHYSAAFSVLYIVISQYSWLRISSIFKLLALLSAVAGMFLAVDSYFWDKLSLYSSFQAPGPLSGLSKIAPVMMISVGIVLSRLPSNEKSKLILIGFVFTAAGWAITQYSYAGLRLLDLISFLLPLSILASYSRLQLKFDRPLKLSIVAAGMLSAAGVCRGFLLWYGEGKCSWMPYEVHDFDLFLNLGGLLVP